ncbi:transcription elongation factor [Arcticibacterium luteifluviistationis]|uniref:Transcription elongation factor n=1 Tax=Arcticibacterium luteifluviistationis TaxID=1784714 RepID=A0A2Z4GFK5_9BACT|nr:transcription elongation factor [Arcticibacterium luteifluviistationis]AWW00170.1 transcription elongation factor [Arcticibacterium luteifluviistationis]
MKKELLDIAKAKVQLRLSEAKKAMEAAQDAANEDTKSSAGDKFETSRAMAHNDHILYSRQWHEANHDWNILQSINPEQSFVLASQGSLVKTSMGLFFLCISSGVLEAGGEKVMLTSLLSPIGEILKGKKKGEKVNFRGKDLKVLSVN